MFSRVSEVIANLGCKDRMDLEGIRDIIRAISKLLPANETAEITAMIGLELHYFYRAMDFLVEVGERLEKEIFKQVANLFNLRVDLIFLIPQVCILRRRQKEVERAFRELEHPFDIRPMYHRLEESLRGHVMLCWLVLVMGGWGSYRLLGYL